MENQEKNNNQIIIYNTEDGQTVCAMNQPQMW